jgi:hypothetical protein
MGLSPETPILERKVVPGTFTPVAMPSRRTDLGLSCAREARVSSIPLLGGHRAR